MHPLGLLREPSRRLGLSEMLRPCKQAATSSMSSEKVYMVVPRMAKGVSTACQGSPEQTLPQAPSGMASRMKLD